MINAIKYRLYPTAEQQELLSKYFGSVRWVYNEALAHCIEQYKTTGKTPSEYLLINRLPVLKIQHPWLCEAPSQSLQQSMMNLANAFKNFFSGKYKYPKFKNKHAKQSIRFVQNLHINTFDIKLPKIGKIDALVHKTTSGTVKSITISKNAAGQYHASVIYEDNIDTPKPNYNGKLVGIDLGVKDIIVASDGYRVANPKIFKKYLKNLKRKQQALARCKDNTKRRLKAKLKVAKIHNKITNARKDLLHKISRRLVDENQVIIFESLKIGNMIKNRHLAQAIITIGWDILVNYTAYKAARLGKVVLYAPLNFPSSKLCHVCGHKYKELTLKDREWVCPSCGTHHDRDDNASLNLQQYGEMSLTHQGLRAA